MYRFYPIVVHINIYFPPKTPQPMKTEKKNDLQIQKKTLQKLSAKQKKNLIGGKKKFDGSGDVCCSGITRE